MKYPFEPELLCNSLYLIQKEDDMQTGEGVGTFFRGLVPSAGVVTQTVGLFAIAAFCALGIAVTVKLLKREMSTKT